MTPPRRAPAAWSMVAVMAGVTACTGGGADSAGMRGDPSEARSEFAEAAEGTAPQAESGAGASSQGLTGEEIASQLDRDLAEYQRMMAARRTGGGAARSAGADPAASDLGGSAGTGATAAGEGSRSGAGGSGVVGDGGTGFDPRRLEPAEGAGGDPSVASSGMGAGGLSTPAPGPRVIAETPEALAAAAAALYRDASRADTPMRSLMALAALSIADPDRPFNPDALSDITEEERRTLSSFHAFCRELGRRLASSDDSEEVVRAVEQLAREMRGERRLRIQRAEFCVSVDGFGAFEGIEPREFVAHSAARFVLYFEIDGYRSTEVAGEGWKTELSIELSILSERDGVPVWRREWQTITDLAASQRKDFFVTHVIAIPDALSVGAYALKIRVRDEQTGGLAERAIPFRMVAAPVSTPPSSSPRR